MRHHGSIVCALGLLIAITGCSSPMSVALPAAVPPQAVAAYPGLGTSPLLIDPNTLRDRLSSGGDVRVLDLSPLPTYRRAHVPGAVHAWWQDTMNVDDPIYGTILPQTQQQRLRQELLADLGINEHVRVVAYDNDNGRWAARMAWFLLFLGMPDVSILDGGLAAWIGAGGSLSSTPEAAPAVAPATIVPQSGWYLTSPQLERRLRAGSFSLIDARTSSEAADTLNGSLPLGRIPGSIAIPWTASLGDGAGRLLPPDRLAALYAAVPDLDRPIVVYARFGVEADHTWLVLTLLGYRNVAVYDPGWAGWAADPTRAIDPL